MYSYSANVLYIINKFYNYIHNISNLSWTSKVGEPPPPPPAYTAIAMVCMLDQIATRLKLSSHALLCRLMKTSVSHDPKRANYSRDLPSDVLFTRIQSLYDNRVV